MSIPSIVDGTLISHDSYHVVFTGPPGFAGLQPLIYDANDTDPYDHPYVLGGANIFVVNSTFPTSVPTTDMPTVSPTGFPTISQTPTSMPTTRVPTVSPAPTSAMPSASPVFEANVDGVRKAGDLASENLYIWIIVSLVLFLLALGAVYWMVRRHALGGKMFMKDIDGMKNRSDVIPEEGDPILWELLHGATPSVAKPAQSSFAM